jgi:M6 family metalloprotease-like protein
MYKGLSFALCSLLVVTGCSEDANTTITETTQNNTELQTAQTVAPSLTKTYATLNVAIAVPKFSTKITQGKHLTKPLGTSDDIDSVTLKVMNEAGEILASDIALNYVNNSYTGTVPALPINERLTIIVSAFNADHLEIFQGTQETVLVDNDSNAVSITMEVLDDGKDITIPRLTKIVVGETSMQFYVDDNGTTPTLDYTIESTDDLLSFVQSTDTITLEDGAYIINVDYNASDYGTFLSNFTIENTLGGKLSTSFSTTITDDDGDGNFSVSLAPVISGIHIIRNGEDLIVDVKATDDGDEEALSYEWRFEPLYDGGQNQSFLDNRVNPATMRGYNANVTGYLHITVKDGDDATSSTSFTIRQNQFPDFTAPIILNTTPNHDATAININSPLLVTFDEVMGEVSDLSIMVTPEIDFDVETEDNRLYTLTPTQALSYDQEYIVTFTNRVTDASDNALVAQSIRFTTQANENDQNSAPIATYSGFNTAQNSEYNATLTATDADGDILTYSIVSDVSHGTLTTNSSGSFGYLPANNYKGTDTFVYKANDGQIDSNEKTVSIIVGEESNTTLLPILLVRIEFNDFSFHSDTQTWSNKVFGENEGELAHYYSEISNGAFSFTHVTENDATPNDGIVTVSLNENHPGDSDSAFWPRLVSAINQADDSVDFSQYDHNGDAKISKDELQIMFIVAGGEAAYGDAPSVWAHAWCIYDGTAPIVDGVQVMECGSGGYSRFGERQGNHDATIGVIAHELGHAAHNLPDLYDYGNDSQGIGSFGLMGSGSWTTKSGDSFYGQTPVHMSAWSKLMLDWTDVTDIEAGTAQHSLKATNLTDYNVLRVPTGTENEYFLIENRGTSGYDRGLESIAGTYNGGLAIWHIDDNVVGGRVNDDENHKRVDLEELNNIGMDDNLHRGHANNLMFEGNVDNFTPSTTPNSNNYAGTSTGVQITAPSAQGDTMTVTITR